MQDRLAHSSSRRRLPPAGLAARGLAYWVGLGTLMIACVDPTATGDDDDGASTRGSGASSQGGGGGEGGGDALVPCDGGFLCGEACLDLSGDPLHCGGCDRACSDGEICSGGTCEYIADCTVTPCTGLSYCDLGSKQCRPGCIESAQCNGGQTCDLASHTCGCPSGMHLCGGTCSSDSSPLTCGSSCTPCPTDPHGDASCQAGSCKLSCDAGYHLCGDACADSSSPLTCGSACAPCPTDPDGDATCEAGQCGLACDPGFWSCAQGCCGFATETVANANPSAVDIAVTGSAVHVAYNGYDTGLVAALRTGGTWTRSTVDSGGYKHVSLALTPGGQPWIAYQWWTSGQSIVLRVARKVGSSFQIDEVTTSGCCSSGSALAIDGAGNTFLAYNYDGSNNGGDIRLYAYGGGWDYQGLTSYHQHYTDLGVAIDASGRARVGFSASYSGTNEAVWNGTQWAVESFQGDTGGHVAIAFSGNQGALVNCYTDGLRFGSFGGSWSHQTLSTASTSACDVAIDGAGRPHVLAIHAGTLRYRTLEGTTWKVIDLASNVASAAITLDAMGNPHVVYENDSQVLYAHTH